MMAERTVSLSVLITYHEEGELLRECLHSLVREAVLPDEIIVTMMRPGGRPGSSCPRV